MFEDVAAAFLTAVGFRNSAHCEREQGRKRDTINNAHGIPQNLARDHLEPPLATRKSFQKMSQIRSKFALASSGWSAALQDRRRSRLKKKKNVLFKLLNQNVLVSYEAMHSVGANSSVSPKLAAGAGLVTPATASLRKSDAQLRQKEGKRQRQGAWTPLDRVPVEVHKPAR
ncbi:hypothetical protein [Rhizobium halophilum]|uniref:hypothetical protein n=1 Tax=Rhizobium halophilum TaxID=2846852 RepID=UPI001EFCB251|nr:hypothetical protein [Rhizobium halophilum]MCF6369387.1 hypothetical protein [Rhizobium halophilum]